MTIFLIGFAAGVVFVMLTAPLGIVIATRLQSRTLPRSFRLSLTGSWKHVAAIMAKKSWRRVPAAMSPFRLPFAL